MRGGRVFAALRRPLLRRVPIRRSTAVMVVLFVALAGLLAYHSYITPSPPSSICIGDNCAPLSHTRPTTTTDPNHAATTPTTDPPPTTERPTTRPTTSG
ncbi:MAG: hypothetical protein J2O47_10585 [Acidimicrobiaceae bacterium]|nr:hypothetical protein [Acidimicrobiaceae bacterium]